METQPPNAGHAPLPAALGRRSPGATYESSRTRCAFYQLAPGVVLSQMAGHIDRGAAEALRSFGERQLSRGIPQRFFHDWEAVSGYESEARALLTTWSLERRTLIRGVVVLTQSKIVAMGVATANLATSVVGVHMQSHMLRAPFERELLDAVRGD